jgi:hypothetical protein
MNRTIIYILITAILSNTLIYGDNLEIPKTKKSGYNCLFVGHSYFIPVAKLFEKLPEKYGVVNHRQQTVFRGGSSGSASAMWKNKSSRKAVQKVLDGGNINLLGLVYHSKAGSSEFDDFKRWVDYALKCNPKTSFFFGHRWESGGPTRKLEEYDRLSRENSEKFYTICERLRKIYPKNTFYFVNYGLASVKLKGLFEAGHLSEVSSMVAKETGVYADKGGHASTLLKELSTLMWLKVLYNVDARQTRGESNPAQTKLIKMAEDLVAEQLGRKQKMK